MYTKKPDWLKAQAATGIIYEETKKIIDKEKLNTVCEQAACPNIGDCWNKKHATFIILGNICTRACKFCNIKTGIPGKPDPHEPRKIADSIRKLNLQHVVITSVDRDDLQDGGASHFAKCIQYIKKLNTHTSIEILTPDFLHKNNAYKIILEAQPDVFNHNIETVPSLYKTMRPGARYFNSLKLLNDVKSESSGIFTKSGIMLGLGEKKEEILQVMDDMRSADIDFITIGQYLQPSPKHAAVVRFILPNEFKFYGEMAKAKGFLMVSSSPLTRSSYHAAEDFIQLKKNTFTKSIQSSMNNAYVKQLPSL